MKNTKIKTRIEESLDLWQRMRRRRIAFIIELLISEKEVDEKEFLGYISTEYGIRRQTSEEYLRDLQDYGLIEIRDGRIRWLGKEQSEEE